MPGEKDVEPLMAATVDTAPDFHGAGNHDEKLIGTGSRLNDRFTGVEDLTFHLRI